VLKLLKKGGIECGLHYPTPLHMQEAYRYLGHVKGDFPRAERWAERGLSLPMFPTRSEHQVDTVCRALLQALEETLP
jgi:dTDP-4-amino-4,6-dideoxygalactose transaminase